MVEILELAEQDKTLSFLINEIDNSVDDLSGFSRHQSINDLKNQQARLKEFIGVHLDSEVPDYFDCPTKKFTFLLLEMYLR